MLKNPPKIASIVPRREKPASTELKVLDRYVEQIRLWSNHPDRAGEIRFGSVTVEVSPWAAEALLRFSHAPVPTEGDLDHLVAQAVAAIAKCRSDLATSTDPADLNQVYAKQAESMLGFAVGTVLVESLQEKCNELIAAGHNDEVRGLNALQHEVRNTVRQVKSSLSESEMARANEFVSAFGGEEADAPEAGRPEPTARIVAPQARARASTGVEPSPSQAASRPNPFLVRERTDSRTGLTTYAFWLAIFAMVAGLAAFGIGHLGSDPVGGDASESLRASLADIPGVTAVEDRNPYALLTVQDGLWETSDESRRRSWIEDAGRLAERHGYSGLLIRSSGGAPLGEWVRDRGVKFPEETR